jgi:hypothetical protein
MKENRTLYRPIEEVVKSPILGDIRLEEFFQVESVGLDEGRDGFGRVGIIVDLSLLPSELESLNLY